MQRNRYICCTCGTLSGSIRCGRCGNDCEPYEAETLPSPMNDDDRPAWRRSDAVQSATHRAYLAMHEHKIASRRFTGAPMTGFGGFPAC